MMSKCEYCNKQTEYEEFELYAGSYGYWCPECGTLILMYHPDSHHVYTPKVSE
jgi:DNA-directed RNA polymerase subunit RPC12/RpoP